MARRRRDDARTRVHEDRDGEDGRRDHGRRRGHRRRRDHRRGRDDDESREPEVRDHRRHRDHRRGRDDGESREPEVRDHRDRDGDRRRRRGRTRRHRNDDDRPTTSVAARRGRAAEPDGVDRAAAVRALIHRLGEVFDDPDDSDEFLAFPVTPIVLPEPGSAGFADLVNRIPDTGPVWRGGAGRLVDPYRDTLTNAVVAEVKRSDSERDDLAEARELLYREDEDGRRHPSPDLQTYRELRDAHTAAKQHLNEVLAHDPDPAEESAARTAVEDAHDALVGRGNQAEIEDALSTIDQLEGQRPLLAWNDADALLAEHERIDADSGATYYETTAQPPAVDDIDWTTLRLDVDDLEERATALEEADADAGECSPIPTTGAPEEVGSVRAKAALLQVVRPWFRPSLLEQRTWRYPLDREPLSDGGDPPSGRLPAYVVGTVVLRDLVLAEEDADEDGTTRTAATHVAALRCRRLAAAPDPDPALDWSG